MKINYVLLGLLFIAPSLSAMNIMDVWNSLQTQGQSPAIGASTTASSLSSATATRSSTTSTSVPAEPAKTPVLVLPAPSSSEVTAAPLTKEQQMREALKGNGTAMHLLLDEGFALDFKFKDGNTLLSLAATLPDPAPCALLLDRKANPNAYCEIRNPHGEIRTKETPLIKAISAGHPATVELLLNRKAQPELRNYWGTLPLQYAFLTKSSPELLKHRSAIAQSLVAHKASVNAVSPLFGTPLITASRDGDAAAVKELLALKADPILIFNGRNARYEAAEAGHSEIVKLMDAAAYPKDDAEKSAAISAAERDKKWLG